jgi:hypothetical protein
VRAAKEKGLPAHLDKQPFLNPIYVFS